MVLATRKLQQYFQSHSTIVKTNLLVKKVLDKPDLAERMVAWSVELSEYDIQYELGGSIKEQALIGFTAELVEENTNNKKGAKGTWVLSVDGSSNLSGSDSGVTLEGPDKVLLEQSLRFGWKSSNSQAENEVLIAGMVLATDLGVENLKA